MKKILYLSLSLNVVIVLFIAAKRIYYREKPATNSFYETWNSMRSDLLSSLPIDSNDVVFVGTSLTEGFPVTEVFGRNCKNRGIGGNQTAHVLSRIGAIASAHPKKIFIEAGINDINQGVTPDSVVSNIIRMVGIVKLESPKTIVYIQSILPTAGAHAVFNAAIIATNTQLKNYCTSSGIAFVDIHSIMWSGKDMRPTYTADGLHLNSIGYKVWQSAVAELI